MNPENGTKKKLISALLELMQSRSVSDITVKEIAYMARVSRRTFYSYCSSINDLLKQHLMKLSSSMIESCHRQENLTLELYIEQFFSFWSSNITIFKLVLNDPNIHSMQIFNKLLDFIEIELESILPEPMTKTSDYISVFFSGGVFSMVEKWTKSDNPESPKQMADMCIKIINGLSSIPPV